ncbi:MAG TPA: AMP-binding protein [Gemmatimonadales bacterium]|nr:AMP-binding protein [Gemmatimonadales bacterium]
MRVAAGGGVAPQAQSVVGEAASLEALNPNVARLLWRAAAGAGTAPAVSERERRTTYAALRERAGQIGASLLAAGVARGDRVAILLERGAEAAAAFFGALAAGAIAVVVNETLRPRQIEHILTHSGARHLIAAGELLARQPRALCHDARLLDVATLASASDGFEPVACVGGDVAQIVYTSGSTGLPKGVAVSHANLWAATRAVVSYLGLAPSDRVASLLPLSFVYGMSQLLCAIDAGACLVVERSPLAQQMVDALVAHEVTVLAAVPPLWMRLLQVPAFRDRRLPALRVMTNAGGHLPAEVVHALRRAQADARLFLMYGLTEVLRSTYLPPEELDRRPDSIGRPIPGAEVYVLREDGTPAAVGEIGELVHRGPTVTLGYWNDAELTAKVFRPNPLRPAGAPDAERVVFSGDLVRADASGFLYYVSRKDRIIKTMGYRVGPDEVANVLYASGEVTEAIVTGEPDDARGERIVAFVVLAAGGSLERLKAHCRCELPRYMEPARIEVRDALPVLPSGKHDLAALRRSLEPAGREPVP